MGMMSMYMCYICMDDSDVLNSQDKKKTKLKVKKKEKTTLFFRHELSNRERGWTKGF